MSFLTEEIQVSEAEGIDDIFIKEERSLYLKQALEMLKSEELELVKDLYFENRKQKDLCEKYGITQGSLSERKRRILKKLKKILEDTQYFS